MFNLRQALLITVTAVLFTACNNNKQENAPTPVAEVNLQKGEQLIPDTYIVTYNTSNNRIAFSSDKYESRSVTMRNYTEQLVKAHGVSPAQITQTYNTALQGFSAKLSPKEVKALKADPRVAAVEQDRMLTLDFQATKVNDRARQSTPWGINRVGRANGSGKTAWVIDTGIDLDHPDLNVNTSRSRSFVGGSPNDGNGHGTHVAGTIAAKNNNIGVVGVAYNASVVAVKVLSNSGSGSVSGIVRGVDYVAAAARRGDVANLSLGGGVSTAMDNAVRRLASRGILVSLAAGNSRIDARFTSPARVNYPNVVTVSAMDINNRFASFSNYGFGVDYCGPGVNVSSAWAGGGYRSISGTSMAAPHIAGLMLLRGSTSLRTNGFVINDPDGRRDPIAVR